MNRKQTLIAMRILVDPRLPLEYTDIFTDAMLDRRTPAVLDITDEQLEVLAQYVPDLVLEYRSAGSNIRK